MNGSSRLVFNESLKKLLNWLLSFAFWKYILVEIKALSQNSSRHCPVRSYEDLDITAVGVSCEMLKWTLSWHLDHVNPHKDFILAVNSLCWRWGICNSKCALLSFYFWRKLCLEDIIFLCFRWAGISKSFLF